MANEHEVITLFSQGLHKRNAGEVREVAVKILSDMDDPHKYSISWTVHDFARKFQFVLSKGWVRIAKSPWIDTINDRDYIFYIMLFKILSCKNVDISKIGTLTKHAEQHGTKEFINEANIIAKTIH